MSLICNIRKPLGTFIGFVNSFIFRLFIVVLILLFSEFSLIQSNFPPRVDVGDVLYLSAAKSKPLLFIALLISWNLLSNSLRFETSKEISDNKYDFINLLLFFILFLNSFSLILTFEENLIKINSFHSASISNLFLTFSKFTLLLIKYFLKSSILVSPILE